MKYRVLYFHKDWSPSIDDWVEVDVFDTLAEACAQIAEESQCDFREGVSGDYTYCIEKTQDIE